MTVRKTSPSSFPVDLVGLLAVVELPLGEPIALGLVGIPTIARSLKIDKATVNSILSSGIVPAIAVEDRLFMRRRDLDVLVASLAR
jgi:hypothetical protein